MVQVGSALGSIHVWEPPATNPPARHYLGGGSFLAGAGTSNGYGTSSRARFDAVPASLFEDAAGCPVSFLAALCGGWHFKLLDECRQTRRHRFRSGIVIGLEMSPDCQQPCPSVRQNARLPLADHHQWIEMCGGSVSAMARTQSSIARGRFQRRPTQCWTLDRVDPTRVHWSFDCVQRRAPSTNSCEICRLL